MMQPNQINNNNKINGLPEGGVYYGQNERVDEINDRVSSRHFPDSPLEPNFDPRSIPTKYSHFPIINRRAPTHEPVIPYINYNTKHIFNPGNSRAPISGHNIDVETVLRNQTFGLQRKADQNIYIPSSTSDLYNVHVISRPSEQTHPLLFDRQIFDSSVHQNNANPHIGGDRFFNHTRTQLRNTVAM